MSENIPQVPLETAELDLIQKYFKGNDELLLAMRAVMMNLNPSDSDKNLVKEAFSDNSLFEAVSYRFLPTPKRSTPIGQIQDIWLGAETMVFGQSVDAIKQAVEYKERSIDMTQTALMKLRDPEQKGVSLMYSAATTTNDPLQIGLLARNQFMRHIEQQLLFLKLVAEQKVDPKEAAKAGKKNSSE